MTISNEQAHLNALHNELAYVQAQPNVREDRVEDIKAEIERLTPDAPQESGELEAAVVEAPEQAVQSKARGRKAE